MLPEHKILIDFLNNRFDVFHLERIAPESWGTLVSEAGRHRVAPLLYSKIKLAEAESIIPMNVLQKLREKYLANAYRNTVLFHQLSEIVTLLNKKNIPVILLKGAHLAEFVYKDIALRPMSDLDILVKEEHLSEVVQIAFSAGYQFFYEKQNAKKKTNDSYCYDILKYYKHFQPLIHPETKCLLEIHCFITEVGSHFQIPVSDLWDSSQPATLYGNVVSLLSPEDLIIHLCLHAAYDHLFDFGMGALYDISKIIDHCGESINWDKIERRSMRWGADRCLLLALYFTKKWLGASIPDKIFENFQIDNMVCIAEKNIFKTAKKISLHPHFIHWRNRKSVRDKISYIQGVLFPSRDFMANRYIKPKHSKVIFSSYFFRFLQALQGLFTIAKAVFQDNDYVSRLKKGDNDFRLREWLTRS
ncbi:MAG: nucleotidyltransferase family protein [Desulfobacteraceae bacterium]|jgi:hypothetical protein|nr:nucleotidyltransferase family protein [Desulfobacteraceae bacterium]